MPNQHVQRKRVLKRCANQECRKHIYITEHQAEKLEAEKRVKYCSNSCARSAIQKGKHVRWYPEVIVWLKENIGKMTTTEICTHLNGGVINLVFLKVKKWFKKMFFNV